MLHRSRFAKWVLILLASVLPAMAQGFPVTTIPEGIDMVVVINNHPPLSLQDLVTANPKIPPQAKDMFVNFTKAVSFNPFTDISSIQLMAQIEPKGVVAIATGKFDTEKLLAQLSLAGGGKEVVSSKINDLPAVSSKDGKASLCFINPTTCVAGTPDLVKRYVDDFGAKKINASFAGLLGKANDKAYVTAMIAGENLGKILLQKIEEGMKKKEVPPLQAYYRDWAYSHFLKNTVGKSVFAHQLDDRFEMWINYDHGDAKDCNYHFLSENNDPNFRIDTVYKEFLKVLAALPTKE